MESIKKDIQHSESKRREVVESLEKSHHEYSAKKERFSAHRPEDSFNLKQEEEEDVPLRQPEIAENLQKSFGGEEAFRQTNVFLQNSIDLQEEPGFAGSPKPERDDF